MPPGIVSQAREPFTGSEHRSLPLGPSEVRTEKPSFRRIESVKRAADIRVVPDALLLCRDPLIFADATELALDPPHECSEGARTGPESAVAVLTGAPYDFAPKATMPSPRS